MSNQWLLGCLSFIFCLFTISLIFRHQIRERCIFLDLFIEDVMQPLIIFFGFFHTLGSLITFIKASISLLEEYFPTVLLVVLSSYLVSYVIAAKVVLSVTTGLELSLWGFAQHLLVFCTLAGYKVRN